jgi:hypothetical protein
MGIEPLSEAIVNYPLVHIVVYNRVSGYDLAGTGLVKLEDKTKAASKEIIKQVSAFGCHMVLRTFQGVEKGKMSAQRKILEDAASFALAKACMLVAPNLSRLIRAETYDHLTNPNAW